MRAAIAAFVHATLRRAGWVAHRWPANRFEAMDDTLRLLAAAGFRPGVVLDIGANTGTWTEMAARHFDARQFHLVEPQPSCHPALARFAPPRFIVHALALTSAGPTSVQMLGTGGTGAWVVPAGSAVAGARSLPATSLDALLGGAMSRDDRALRKLDVQCHELPILRAGHHVLQATDVVISEMQLFEVNDNGQAVLLDLMAFMKTEGFVLYDVASLAGRARDGRLRGGDVVFVREDSPLAADRRWA